jgi:exopolysaccharide biosynthesis polyprenyl glycosylphosphotransferase
MSSVQSLNQAGIAEKDFRELLEELYVKESYQKDPYKISYNINRFEEKPVQFFLKRFIEITGTLLGLIILFPLLVAITIAIKLTSKGPVLFTQKRLGQYGKEFHMYKFRSMKVQTEEEEKSQWTTKNDPRKTRFGEFIRKTSIDELPQLFNVLKGDMSIIGPRPERPFFVDKFREEVPKYMIKHHVRPGITGWAQVNGFRGDTSIKARIDYDIFYIDFQMLF